EFRLLALAHDAGVRVPRPRWLCNDAAVLGSPFFVMDYLAGESVGRRVVREPALAEARRRLPGQLAEQLALIHALPLDAPVVGPPPARCPGPPRGGRPGGGRRPAGPRRRTQWRGRPISCATWASRTRCWNWPCAG